MARRSVPRVTDKADEHAEWEARLGRMGTVIDHWAERIKAPPSPMQPSSSLEADDRQFKVVNVSDVAWYSITTAVEHLDFTIQHFRATRTLYPSAHMTVLRTALVTGAIAAWVLSGPTRGDRQLRALRVECDEVGNTLAAINGAKVEGERQVAAVRKAQTSIGRQHTELQAVADALGGPADVRKWRLNTTEIVEAAARVAFGEETVLTSGVGLLWRRGSAAAHGAKSVVTLGLDPAEVERSEEGILYVNATGSLARDVGPLAVAAFQMTNHAFGEYDKRRFNYLR